MLALGFSSGLPAGLGFGTLSIWLPSSEYFSRDALPSAALVSLVSSGPRPYGPPLSIVSACR